MSQVIGIFAAAAVLLLPHATLASVHADPATGIAARPSPPTADDLVSPRHRCGPATETSPTEASAAAIASMAPLINGYMTVNGRVFTLADAFRCAANLHTTRVK